jgi:cytochrome c-type biogenesis protein
MLDANATLAAGVADPPSGVGVLAALAAGVVSFLSPCVLPLVPGYLSAVSGIRPTDLEDAPLWKVLGPSLLFVLSFSAIFIVLGLTATKLGSSLNAHLGTLETVSGVIIIVLGLFFIATSFVPVLAREWRVEGLMTRAGRGGPVLAGAAFAIAWTPCIGPTLGAILSAAALSDTTARGAYLLAWYSAGLAIPFLLAAVAFNRMTTVFAAVKRHYGLIVGAGGAILVVMGVLILTGELTQLNIEAQKLLNSVGLDFLYGI